MKNYEELMDEEGLKNTAHERFLLKARTFDLKSETINFKINNISTDDDMGQLRNT